MSILVIGQDEETVKAISSALDDSECPVQRAADGTEGFARLSSRAQYKLIITDLAMPGMDGFQYFNRCIDTGGGHRGKAFAVKYLHQ